MTEVGGDQRWREVEDPHSEDRSVRSVRFKKWGALLTGPQVCIMLAQHAKASIGCE